MLCLVVLVAIGCQNEREKENEGFRGKMEFITEKFKEKEGPNELKERSDKKSGITTVKEIYHEYDLNEIRFKKTFHGKRFKIQGVIHYVSLNNNGIAVIDFDNDGLFGGRVSARGCNEIDGRKIIDLNKGDEIIIEGLIKVNNFGIFIHCDK